MEGCSNSSSSLSSCFALLTLFSLLVFTTNMKSCSAAGVDSSKNSTEFIKTSCQVTEYPHVCFESLVVYASTIQTNPMELVNAALSVTLTNVRSASATMSTILARRGIKPREVGAMKDCVENIGDSVDELRKSVVEMDHLQGPDFYFHMSNLQTWVSEAMTGETTCMDGFSWHNMDSSVKNAIRNCMVNAEQLTSIALALINSLASA